MKNLQITLLIVLGFLVSSMPVWGDTRTINTREIEKYPFHANPDREAKIKNGYGHIIIGITPEQVKEILGEPDEVRYLYEPRIKMGKKIGYTHWFVIRRLVKSGSVNDRDESLVRVSFNFEDKVTAIHSWGVGE